MNPQPTFVSFHPEENSKFLVTGKNCYNYLKVSDGTSIKGDAICFNKNTEHQSSYYTGHLWIANKIVVTTSDGQILFGEFSGEYKGTLPDSPGEKFPIRSIVAVKDKNFIISDNTGRFKYYQYVGFP